MGKKRKFSGPSTSASTSSPRMRLDVKEEKSVAGTSGRVYQAPARFRRDAGAEAEWARGMLPSAAATGGGIKPEVTHGGLPGGDVQNARDRLRNVLQEIVEQSDDDSAASSSEETSPHDARHTIVKKEPSLPAAQSLKNMRQQQRRRRRRELLSDSAFHHTYVMKLFDRSVDLAQFKEDTSLYPVCRAWMANQPHNTNLVPKMRTPTPEPPPEEQLAAMESSGSGDDSDLVRDTYKMPPPQPLPDDETERKQLRIPSPVPRERENIELDYEVKPPLPKEVLLQEHLTHWAAVRKKWHDTSRKNSARFGDSSRILKAIYRKAQKAYE